MVASGRRGGRGLERPEMRSRWWRQEVVAALTLTLTRTRTSMSCVASPPRVMVAGITVGSPTRPKRVHLDARRWVSTREHWRYRCRCSVGEGGRGGEGGRRAGRRCRGMHTRSVRGGGVDERGRALHERADRRARRLLEEVLERHPALQARLGRRRRQRHAALSRHEVVEPREARVRERVVPMLHPRAHDLAHLLHSQLRSWLHRHGARPRFREPPPRSKRLTEVERIAMREKE